MAEKPSIQELLERVKALESEAAEARRTKAALIKSEERFRIVAHHLSTWEQWTRPDGKYVYISPSCERITGYRPEDFQDTPSLLEAITHPDDRERLVAHLQQEHESPDTLEVEFRIITRANEEKWIRCWSNAVFGAHGNLLGRRSGFLDVTDRVQIEDALKESEEKYRTLFDESMDAVFVAGRKGEILDINKAALKLFGYTRDEALGKLNIRDLFEDPSARERFRQDIERSGVIRDYEVTLKKKNDVEMDCLVTAALWLSHGGYVQGYQCIVRDTTEAKRTSERLGDSERRLGFMEEDQTELICRFYHDGAVTHRNPAFDLYFNADENDTEFSFIERIRTTTGIFSRSTWTP